MAIIRAHGRLPTVSPKFSPVTFGTFIFAKRSTTFPILSRPVTMATPSRVLSCRSLVMLQSTCVGMGDDRRWWWWFMSIDNVNTLCSLPKILITHVAGQWANPARRSIMIAEMCFKCSTTESNQTSHPMDHDGSYFGCSVMQFICQCLQFGYRHAAGNAMSSPAWLYLILHH